MAAFEQACPHVRLDLKEVAARDVADAIEEGEADLGFAVHPIDPERTRLSFEPCYPLEIILITPPDHPLATRRRVRARDLCSYPLVNARSSFADPVVTGVLEALGAFNTQPRRVEAHSVETIRRYVTMGFGIGLIGVSRSHRPDPAFHERPMGHELGRLTVSAIRRRGSLPSGAAGEFVEIVKAVMNPPQDASPNGSR
jgi:LysR family cys regulon transcriptional activator